MASEDNYYVYYVPNKGAAIAGVILFLIFTILHLWKIVSHRKWFAIPISIGGAFEFVALAARAYTSTHLSERNPYIIQILLILLAPILFSASVYMFLGRLIRSTNYPQLSLIRVTWLTKIFVVGDVLCFLVQAFGASKLVGASSTSDIETAQNIILGGLGLQVFFFVIFITCIAVFHYRIVSHGLIRKVHPAVRTTAMLASLYICSLLVMVRNIYRLIEYKEGTGGYLQTHEWPTYGLDVVLMALVMVITMSWYAAAVGKEQNDDHYQLS